MSDTPDKEMPYEGIDRRAPSPPVNQQQLSEVVDVLSKASTSALTLSEKVDDLASKHRKERVLQTILAVGVLAMTVTSVVMIIQLIKLNDIAKVNRANGRLLIECTTPSPAPGKAVDKEDEVHECAENGGKQQQAAVLELEDTNHNGKADAIEILEKQDEIIRLLNR